MIINKKIIDMKSFKRVLGMLLLFLIISSSTVLGQNLSEEETVEYINKKMKISDPVYSSFTLGDNGEAVMKWVTRDLYNEYRFNIREIEIELKLSADGDNYIELKCISGTNNCLQRALRKDTNQTGDDVSFDYYRTLTIESIAGFDNITSLKNALKYLKILSVENNKNSTNSNRDPFLY